MKKINSYNLPQSVRNCSPKRRGAIFASFFGALFMLVTLMSCVDDGTIFPDDIDEVYYGVLTVGDYTQKRVGVSVTETSDTTVEVIFDNVKFAAAMPLKIDITVKDVPCTKVDGVLRFSAVDIDPYMNKELEPQPEYRFATIVGAVEGSELVLEARMSDELEGSRAGKTFSFKGTCDEIK